MANLFRCTGGGESINCIAKPYDPAKTYNKNDVCLYQNLLYICLAYDVTGEWNNSKWKKTTLSELSEMNPNIFYGISWIDNEYDPNTTYNTDDTCMYCGIIYKCLEDNVTGLWNQDKWERTYLLDCTKLSGNLGVNSGQYYINHSAWRQGNPFKVTIDGRYYLMTQDTNANIANPIINGVTKEWTESSHNNGRYQKGLKVDLKKGDTVGIASSAGLMLICFIF